jgi:cyclophilin family peptidyl-prolyl cis-trans isomerase
MRRAPALALAPRSVLAVLTVLSVSAAGAAAPPGPAAPPKKIFVELRTSAGPITLELWNDLAPTTVRNFVNYVVEGQYDGTIFHRVVKNFVVQGGGYTAEHAEKPTHDPIPGEFKAKNAKYTLAMARQPGPDSARAQFFINLRDNANLDPGGAFPCAVFGRVTAGQAVVDQIGALPVEDHAKDLGAAFASLPTTVVRIEKARVLM